MLTPPSQPSTLPPVLQPPQPTAPPRRNPALDALRGIAVLLVYVFHYGGGLKSHNPLIHALGLATETGWTGVILFFALSGFLITGGLWDSFSQSYWLRNFYARRALRIFPLYYAAVGLCAFVSVADGARFSELQCIPVHALFLQNVPIDDLSNRALNGWITLPIYHLWSVAVEVQFYLLWPAVLYLAYRSSRKHPSIRPALHLCLWTFAASWLFRILIWGLHFHLFPDNAVYSFCLPTQAGSLALGAALALALRDATFRPRIQRYALPAFLTGIAVYVITSWTTHSFYLTPRPQFIFGLTGISLAAAAAIPLALQPRRTNSFLSWKPLCWLGRVSYGFYVFHILLQPLFDILATRLTHTASGSPYQAARFFIAFPITAAVAWLSFQYFEEPILNLNRRFPLHNPLPSK